VGDGAVLILAFDGDHFLLGVRGPVRLFARHDHVVDADRDAGARGVEEAEVLHFVEHADRGLQTEFQVAVLHQLAEALLLEQAVDERHVFRQVVVEG
jgi:hypothetical protein